MGLWTDCPWDEIVSDPSIGVSFYDTFITFNHDRSPYVLIGDRTPPWIAASDPNENMIGIARAMINDVDNDEAYIALSESLNLISTNPTADDRFSWWAEITFRVSSITDGALFFGFANTENVGADFLVDNTGELAGDGIMGFQTLCSNPTDMLAVYKAFGSSKTAAETSFSAIIANNTIKAGMKFLPATGLYYYINDTALVDLAYDSETGADYIPPTALTFPVAQEMTLIAGIKTGAANRMTLDLDSWRFAAHWG